MHHEAKATEVHGAMIQFTVSKWIPRALAFLFAMFLAVAAIQYEIAHLLMVQVPIGIVLLSLVVGWKWPNTGSFVFLIVALAGLGLAICISCLLNSDPAATVACLCVPPVICAVLFWLVNRP
jgi:hypothetical protein